MSLYSSNSKVKFLVQAALIAAAYAALTYSGFAFAYGPIQFRYSEALIAFAALTPAAIPGLTIGCILSNLGSAQLGIYDIVFGSLATLLAALFAYLFRKIRVRGMPLLSLAGNVVFNAFIIAGMIVLVAGTPELFWINVVQIFVSELAATYALGLPLFLLMDRLNRKYHMF